MIEFKHLQNTDPENAGLRLPWISARFRSDNRKHPSVHKQLFAALYNHRWRVKAFYRLLKNGRWHIIKRLRQWQPAPAILCIQIVMKFLLFLSSWNNSWAYPSLLFYIRPGHLINLQGKNCYYWPYLTIIYYIRKNPSSEKPHIINNRWILYSFMRYEDICLSCNFLIKIDIFEVW